LDRAGNYSIVTIMSRLKCKKCYKVFEQGFGGTVLALHIGPYHHLKCPACGQSSWFNLYSSVKDPVTWPSQEKKQSEFDDNQLTEEELEKKRIEESKYERS
jgi:hypothetical protein